MGGATAGGGSTGTTLGTGGSAAGGAGTGSDSTLGMGGATAGGGSTGTTLGTGGSAAGGRDPSAMNGRHDRDHDNRSGMRDRDDHANRDVR
jgi:hypothetical protein